MSDVKAPEQAATNASESQSTVAPADTQAQKTETGADYSWIDQLGVEPEAPTPPPQYAPQFDPQYAPRPQYPEYPPQYPPASAPPSIQEDPEQMVSQFVKNPRAYIERLAEDIAERKATEKVAPVIGNFVRAIGHLRQGEVMRAREYAANRLKEYASTDPDLADPSVARDVNRTYSHFINNALRGDPEALAALQNPIAPQLVTQAAKASRAMRSTLNRGPVSYGGTKTEHTSTISGGSSNQNMSNEEAELARRWGISPEQWAENTKKGGS